MGARRLLLVVLITIPGLVAAGCSGHSAQTSAIVMEQKGDLYAIAVDGSRTVRLTSTPGNEHAPARLLRRPQNRIRAGRLHTDDLLGEIWTMNFNGTHQTRLTRGGDGDWDPASSPRMARRSISFETSGASPGRCGLDLSRRREWAESPACDQFAPPPFVRAAGRLAGRAPNCRSTDWNGCSGRYRRYDFRVIDTSGHPTSDLARLPA